MNCFRKIRKTLWSNTTSKQDKVFKKHTRSFEKARLLVRLFYAIQLVTVSEVFGQWSEWKSIKVINSLWPLFWTDALGPTNSVNLIIILITSGIFLSTIFPEKRSARLLAFLGLLLYAAFINSFGKIGHRLHAWTYVSFFFIFLPEKAKGEDRLFKQKFLTVFFAAQAMIMTTYTLAGFWKVYAAVGQSFLGKLSAFSIDGFSNLIAKTLIDNGMTTVLGSFLVNHPGIAFLTFFSGIYFELFALIAIFRPNLHRLWGLALIALHLGSTLILGITFRPNIIILAIFFCCSPFAPQSSFRIKEALMNMPLIYGLRKLKFKTARK